jgi:ribonucleoside-diphosphate reductase alpha chain
MAKQSVHNPPATIPSQFTKDDVNVFDMFEYDYRTSVIRNPRVRSYLNE